jgi:hypothetical protein
MARGPLRRVSLRSRGGVARLHHARVVDVLVRGRRRLLHLLRRAHTHHGRTSGTPRAVRAALCARGACVFCVRRRTVNMLTKSGCCMYARVTGLAIIFANASGAVNRLPMPSAPPCERACACARHTRQTTGKRVQRCT